MFFNWMLRFCCQYVGSDHLGNRYYESKPRSQERPRRFVFYQRWKEPTTVPPPWHAWLHHIVSLPLIEAMPLVFEKECLPNATGTIYAKNRVKREHASESHQFWTPPTSSL